MLFLSTYEIFFKIKNCIELLNRNEIKAIFRTNMLKLMNQIVDCTPGSGYISKNNGFRIQQR